MDNQSGDDKNLDFKDVSKKGTLESTAGFKVE